jgi:hypothetical protein
MTLLLSACGNEQTASDKALSNSNKAVKIGESYITGDISGDDAYDQLNDVLGNLEYAANYSSDERSEDKQKYADYYLQTYTHLLQQAIFLDKGMYGDADSFENVEDNLNKLKEQIKKFN